MLLLKFGYRQSKDGNISLYALLKHEQVDSEMLANTDYLGDELDALAEVIQPADAIILNPALLYQIRLDYPLYAERLKARLHEQSPPTRASR